MPGLRTLLRAAALASAISGSQQDSDVSPTGVCQLRTVPQREWLSTECQRSRDPGSAACYLKDNFAVAFPSGLLLGKEGKKTRHVVFQDAEDIRQLDLVDGKAALPKDCTDGGVACVAGELGNNLVSQTLALELNAGFDACARKGDCAQWCDSAACHSRDADEGLLSATVQNGWCLGLTVRDVLKMANCVLSGKSKPKKKCGLNEARMLDCVADINKNFDAGVANEGLLVCAKDDPPPEESGNGGDDDDDENDNGDNGDDGAGAGEAAAGACGQRSEVMFVADGSNSIGRGEWDVLKSFLSNLAPEFAPIGPVDSRLGLITYSDDVYHYLDLDSTQGQSLPAFQAYVRDELTRKRKSTATGDALLKAWSMWSKRPAYDGVQRLLVLITDGQPTASKRCEKKGFSRDPVACAREMLAELQAAGVTVAFVHVSGAPATLFEGKEDIYLHVDRYSDLATIKNVLLAELCTGSQDVDALAGTCQLRTHPAADYMLAPTAGGGTVMQAVTQRRALAVDCDASSFASCYLRRNFALAFPRGLVLGMAAGASVTFASAAELWQAMVLPSSGAEVASPLPLDCSGDPACLSGLPANPLLAHAVGLALNLGLDACSRAGNCDLFCPRCVSTPGLGSAVVVAGACQGLTADDVLARANCVLRGGGCQISPDDAAACARLINADFAAVGASAVGAAESAGALDTASVNCDTAAPTKAPSRTPTEGPTAGPTGSPSKQPTVSPSKGPTKGPTASPSSEPTKTPTKRPTGGPTISPSKSPSKRPTAGPTEGPTKAPTKRPTGGPTISPSKSPSKRPTAGPTEGPTKAPTKRPTGGPTISPSKSPSKRPTAGPTEGPTKAPTKRPTGGPTISPSKSPSKRPTGSPSAPPTGVILTCTADEVDVVLVMDESQSMHSSNKALIRSFTEDLARELALPDAGSNPGDEAAALGKSRIAMVHFGTGRDVLNTLEDNTSEGALLALERTNEVPNQSSNTWAGLSAAFDMVEGASSLRPRVTGSGFVQRFVVVFTDGTPSGNQFEHGCETSEETGNNNGNKKRYHCVRHYAEGIIGEPHTTFIFVEMPLGNNSEFLDNLFLQFTQPLESDSTGIDPSDDDYHHIAVQMNAQDLAPVKDVIVTKTCSSNQSAQ